MALRILLTLLFVLFFPSHYTTFGHNPGEAKYWCSRTPYPQPCEYFLTQKTYVTASIKQASDFYKISVQLALEGATQAQSHTHTTVGSESRSKLEKAAWDDCLELYQLTVQKLNQSLDCSRSPSCTKFDKQTWVSSALTNLETCRTGFVELGIAHDALLPLMSNNLTQQLISNILSLSNVPFNNNEPSYYKDGFPKWVKPGDRKLLQTSSSPAQQANIVVAQDGSGNVKTIKEAVAAASMAGGKRYVIYIKAGTYNENVEVNWKNIMFVGDAIGKTIISGSKSVGGGSTSFSSATVAVVGDNFIGRDITIRNTAGPQNQQAVALLSGSDLSVFYRCSFEGYQDTLYVYSDRQFYRECNIYGTVDFIFGNAAAVLQDCNIFARVPPGGTNTVTAHGRTDPNQNTGIIIQNCVVTAAADLKPVQSPVRTYLGRPWKQYSRTVYINTFLDSLIDPAGWMEWSGNFALNTLYYAEYMNTGPGSSTANRVKWGGYHVLTSPSQVTQFTVGNFIAGNSWLPATNVPFKSGL